MHRQETERFHVFSYDDLMKRDKVSMDFFWLRDESLEDASELPAPDVLGTEHRGRPAGSAGAVFGHRG